MEFNGIPLGHIWRPDTTVPTITKTIKVTSLKDLEELIGKPTVNQSIDYTDLEDIDDTMDMDLARIGLVGCNVPEIPEGYKPSDDEVKQSIQRAIQVSEAYLKQEENNATNT